MEFIEASADQSAHSCRRESFSRASLASVPVVATPPCLQCNCVTPRSNLVAPAPGARVCRLSRYGMRRLLKTRDAAHPIPPTRGQAVRWQHAGICRGVGGDGGPAILQRLLAVPGPTSHVLRACWPSSAGCWPASSPHLRRRNQSAISPTSISVHAPAAAARPPGSLRQMRYGTGKRITLNETLSSVNSPATRASAYERARRGQSRLAGRHSTCRELLGYEPIV